MKFGEVAQMNKELRNSLNDSQNNGYSASLSKFELKLFTISVVFIEDKI